MFYTLKKNLQTDVYYFWDYNPKRNNLKGERNLDLTVYNFKQYGKGKELFADLLKCVKELFKIHVSVAIPSSGRQKNNVQQLCKSTIRFIPRKERKSTHDGYKITYEDEMDRLEIKQTQGIKKALLIDDICTSGKTMKVYERILREKLKVEKVKKFAFGHKKGEFRRKMIIYIKKDIFDDDLDLYSY